MYVESISGVKKHKRIKQNKGKTSEKGKQSKVHKRRPKMSDGEKKVKINQEENTSIKRD